MRIAVAGGTGVVGSHVVEQVRAAGDEPVVLSRSAGVDLRTGDGLEAALDGVDAVIDVANIKTLRRSPAVAFFTGVSRNLLDAESRAGIGTHVALSIVGSERVPSGYYQGKREQEGLVLGAAGAVLRATQFHEFAAQLLGRMRGPVAVIPKMTSQPIAAREVAAALVAAAQDRRTGMLPELAGPEVLQVPEMARCYARARSLRRRVWAVRLPGHIGSRMAGGALLPSTHGPRGAITYAEWLSSPDAERV